MQIALTSLAFGILLYCCPCLVEKKRIAPWFLRSDSCPQSVMCFGCSRPASHREATDNDTALEVWAPGYCRKVLHTPMPASSPLAP